MLKTSTDYNNISFVPYIIWTISHNFLTVLFYYNHTSLKNVQKLFTPHRLNYFLNKIYFQLHMQNFEILMDLERYITFLNTFGSKSIYSVISHVPVFCCTRPHTRGLPKKLICGNLIIHRYDDWVFYAKQCYILGSNYIIIVHIAG